MLIVTNHLYWCETNYEGVYINAISQIPPGTKLVYLGEEMRDITVALHRAFKADNFRVGHLAPVVAALPEGRLKYRGQCFCHEKQQIVCSHIPAILLGLWMNRNPEKEINPHYLVPGVPLLQILLHLEQLVHDDFHLYEFALGQWRPIDYLARRL
jgi:hypothetical protein